MSWPRQIVFESAFDSRAIATIAELASAIQPSTNDQTLQGREFRYAKARWLERSSSTEFIFGLLTEMMEIANRDFRFDIQGFGEPLLHVTYPVGGHFSWHTDTSYGTMATRKLSVSVLLSDAPTFEGGRLEFCPGGALENGSSAGSAIVFPSYMAHRVSPVTRGERVALVAWMHGSEFR